MPPTLLSHFSQRLAQKAAREGRDLSPRLAAQEMGLPYSTVLALDSNTIAEFPELALVVIPDYLACPLCGPDGLLEIVEVPDADLAPSRRAARAEREQRLAKAEEARRNRRARGRPRRNLAEQG